MVLNRIEESRLVVCFCVLLLYNYDIKVNKVVL